MAYTTWPEKSSHGYWGGELIAVILLCKVKGHRWKWTRDSGSTAGPTLKGEEDKSVTQHTKVLHYYRGLKALHNSTIQPTHHIHCTLTSLQSCSSSLRSWKTQFWQVAPILSLVRCRNLVPLTEGTMDNFSPTCVMYVGDTIQQRTQLICRGGALAQLPPQSCICVWNDLNR